VKCHRQVHRTVTPVVVGSSPAAPAIRGHDMKNFIIQEYNRRTKKYRDLGAVLAATRERAKEIYIEQASWRGGKDILLHAEDAENYRERK